MGASSSQEITKKQENHTKIEVKTEQKSIEQDNTKLENISNIFREKEITLSIKENSK